MSLENDLNDLKRDEWYEREYGPDQPSDICIAGNGAKDGRCGIFGCVCGGPTDETIARECAEIAADVWEIEPHLLAPVTRWILWHDAEGAASPAVMPADWPAKYRAALAALGTDDARIALALVETLEEAAK